MIGPDAESVLARPVGWQDLECSRREGSFPRRESDLGKLVLALGGGIGFGAGIRADDTSIPAP